MTISALSDSHIVTEVTNPLSFIDKVTKYCVKKLHDRTPKKICKRLFLIVFVDFFGIIYLMACALHLTPCQHGR